MVTTQDEKSGLEMLLLLHCRVNLVYHGVHFLVLGVHERASRMSEAAYGQGQLEDTIPSRACFMSNVIQTQIVHNESRPVALRKLVRDVARHVLVYFYKVLQEYYGCLASM